MMFCHDLAKVALAKDPSFEYCFLTIISLLLVTFPKYCALWARMLTAAQSTSLVTHTPYSGVFNSIAVVITKTLYKCVQEQNPCFGAHEAYLPLINFHASLSDRYSPNSALYFSQSSYQYILEALYALLSTLRFISVPPLAYLFRCHRVNLIFFFSPYICCFLLISSFAVPFYKRFFLVVVTSLQLYFCNFLSIFFLLLFVVFLSSQSFCAMFSSFHILEVFGPGSRLPLST